MRPILATVRVRVMAMAKLGFVEGMVSHTTTSVS